MLSYYLYTSAFFEGPYTYWGKYPTLEEALRTAHELQDLFSEAYTPCYILLYLTKETQYPPNPIYEVKTIPPEE